MIKKISKKKFKENSIIFHYEGSKYCHGGLKALFFDYLDGFGYKYMISAYHLGEADLRNQAHYWIYSNLNTIEWYNLYKVAYNDSERFEIPKTKEELEKLSDSRRTLARVKGATGVINKVKI